MTIIFILILFLYPKQTLNSFSWFSNLECGFIVSVLKYTWRHHKSKNSTSNNNDNEDGINTTKKKPRRKSSNSAVKPEYKI
jgi:hypothetical protein